MKFSIKLCFALVLVLLMKGTSAEKDYKKKFAERFGAVLREEGIELFQTVIKILDGFYDTILGETSPSEEEITKIRKHKNDLLDLSKNIENMESKTLIKEIENFVTQKYAKMGDYRVKANKAHDSKKVDIITKALDLSTVKLREAGTKFSIDICDKWENMFKTIPKEELDRYPQYLRINELIADLKKTPGNGKATFDVVKALINFFEYKDWTFLLQIETQTKL